MKTIKPEEISEPLTEGQLETLAEMLGEDPVSREWIECARRLSSEQIFQVHHKLRKLRRAKERDRLRAMSTEQKAAEDAQWKGRFANLDPNGFYGNMGQPETPQEFKNRYGVWPPGYDENGNKISD